MMKFILEYWRELLAIISVIASVLIWIIRKKPKLNEMDNILLKVLEILPNFIYEAELVFTSGEEKKACVLESVKRFVKSQFSVNLPESYMTLISNYIERILSTPQKKEII